MQSSNPYTLRKTITNPLARMLPSHQWQRLVYRLGEKHPPSELGDFGPAWQVLDCSLDALKTLQIRCTLQRDFTLLAITVSSSQTASGGFRAQIYDVPRKFRLADRGVQQALMGGLSKGACFLREPYPFDEPNHQALFIIQNLESVANNVQLVLYGMAKRIDQK